VTVGTAGALTLHPRRTEKRPGRGGCRVSRNATNGGGGTINVLPDRINHAALSVISVPNVASCHLRVRRWIQFSCSWRKESED
jgi:hypothetical protein